MSGLYNKNPIKETFLIGTRFLNRDSLAICLDSVQTQEYYEIVSSMYKNTSYKYDAMIFSNDNNFPPLVNPCALYYYNYFEYYSGNVLALTIRGAINAMQSGVFFTKKLWHISDLNGLKEISNIVDKIFNFYDEVMFVNENLRTIFFSFFPQFNKSKTSIAPLDIMVIEERLK